MSEARAQRGARNPATLLRRAERFRLANEARDDQTRQRRFERRFLSVDMPDSVAARADWSDLGRATDRTVMRLDAPLVRLWRDSVIRETASRLPLPRQAGELSLARLLWSIYRHRGNRAAMLADLRVSEDTFSRGVVKIFSELPRLIKSGVCGISCEKWLRSKRAKP